MINTIYFALTGSLFIYGGVLFYLGKTGTGFSEEKQMFFTVFSSLSILMAFIAFKFHQSANNSKNFAQYYQKKIICWASSEAIGVYGFVLSFLTDSMT